MAMPDYTSYAHALVDLCISARGRPWASYIALVDFSWCTTDSSNSTLDYLSRRLTVKVSTIRVHVLFLDS